MKLFYLKLQKLLFDLKRKRYIKLYETFGFLNLKLI